MTGPSGAELEARRKRLGLGDEWAMVWSRENADAHGFWLSPHSADTNCIESPFWDSAPAGSSAGSMRVAYDAALTAEEQRRAVRDGARVVLAACRKVGRWDMTRGGAGDFVSNHLPELYAAWHAAPMVDGHGDDAADAAILAALAKLAEEPEPAADPMPKPPEGVTVAPDGPSSYRVHCKHGSAMVHTGASREYRMNGYLSQLTPAAARYAADLAEWAARQHARTEQARAEAERARLLEAVRVAREAKVRAAQAASDAQIALYSACSELNRTEAALDAARKAAGLG